MKPAAPQDCLLGKGSASEAMSREATAAANHCPATGGGLRTGAARSGSVPGRAAVRAS